MSLVRKIIEHPEKVIQVLMNGTWMHIFPDELFLKLAYRVCIGKRLDLKHPKGFNEKLQWLKLYDRRPEYTMMVDKYKVREYITEQLGEEYLIPLLGVWDDPDDIDFDALPDQFVLKCNHNSGLGMCICKDKSKLDIKKVKKELRKGLKQNYYLHGREWPYKDVPRKIICEKYMTDNSEEELKDYKVHNFNGIPKVILVCSERFSSEGLHEDFYNVHWEKLKVKRPGVPVTENDIKRPEELGKMLMFSEKLAEKYPFLRTDFYEINGKLYFGEITLFPSSGFAKFEPESCDRTFGEWLEVPEMFGGGYSIKYENTCIWIHIVNNNKEDQDLTDYKFMCCNGEVRCIFTCTERFGNGLKVTFFDKSWNVLPFERHYPKSQRVIKKPDKLDEMIRLAEKLSKDIPFVRVDFYEISGKVYFGELTFFPGSGFEEFTPEKADYELGNWIKLPESSGGALDSNTRSINSGNLTDYKFYCFGGKVKLLGIYSDRNSKKPTKADYFDREFQWIDVEWGYPHAEEVPERPAKFDEMVEIAEKLSSKFPEVRVDLYLCRNRIYFGELTFFDGSGFDKIYPEEWDYKLGSYIKLPEKKKG